jgi:hypothetical protein
MESEPRKKRVYVKKKKETPNPMVALEYYEEIFEHITEFDRNKLKNVTKKVKTNQMALKHFIFDIQECRIKNLTENLLNLNGVEKSGTLITFTDDTWIISPKNILEFVETEFPSYLQKLNYFAPPIK